MPSKNRNELNLANISKRIQSLPLLPSVVCELMQLRPEQDDFFDKIAELAQYEPAFTARVLKIVNSISSSPVNPVTDIHQALVRVGSDEVLSCITMLSVAKVFTPVNDEQRSLWRHSIETACFARYLGQHNESLNLDPSMLYTCGLLHDIGRFVMFNLASNSVDYIASKDWSSPKELPEVEIQFLGFTHAQVGFLAGKRWQLPKVVNEVIRHHHDYLEEEQQKFPEKFKQLIYVIQLADFLSMYLMECPEAHELDKAQLMERIEEHCIAKVSDNLRIDVEDLIESIPALLELSEGGMSKLKIA